MLEGPSTPTDICRAVQSYCMALNHFGHKPYNPKELRRLCAYLAYAHSNEIKDEGLLAQNGLGHCGTMSVLTAHFVKKAHPEWTCYQASVHVGEPAEHYFILIQDKEGCWAAIDPWMDIVIMTDSKDRCDVMEAYYDKAAAKEDAMLANAAAFLHTALDPETPELLRRTMLIECTAMSYGQTHGNTKVLGCPTLQAFYDETPSEELAAVMSENDNQISFMASYLNKLPTKPSSVSRLTDTVENKTTRYLVTCLFSQRKQSVSSAPPSTSTSVFQAVMMAAVATTLSVTMAAMFQGHEA